MPDNDTDLTKEELEAVKVEEMIAKQKDNDLKAIANSPQGARLLLDKINCVIFGLDLYTGNAGTHYNLGMRQSVMNEINALLTLLDQESYTDLIVYLTKKSKGE
jgi:hypothetical protein